MSLHRGQKYYHEVCTNYLSHSATSSIVSGKGSWSPHRAPDLTKHCALESSVSLLMLEMLLGELENGYGTLRPAKKKILFPVDRPTGYLFLGHSGGFFFFFFSLKNLKKK